MEFRSRILPLQGRLLQHLAMDLFLQKRSAWDLPVASNLVKCFFSVVV